MRRSVRVFGLCLAVFLFAVPSFAQGDLPASRAGDATPTDDYEQALTDLLQLVVTPDGLVRYDRLRASLRPDLRRILKAIEGFDASTLETDAEKLAFWMNAYNVQMLYHLVETPDINNIVEDGYADTFFKAPLRTAGHAVSLDQIEHVILRRTEGPQALRALQVSSLDPRIHVGLNCGAVDCPRLRPEAFTSETVGTQLDQAMHDFTASPRHFSVQGARFVFSSLLDWFGDDFDAPTSEAGDYLLQFMPEDRPDYAALRAALEGRTAAEIKADERVSFRYRWKTNAAP